ncbi:MAG: Ac79 protein [Cotesia congregata filamentous virus 2]
MESPFGDPYLRYSNREITELLPIAELEYIDMANCLREVYKYIDVYEGVNPEAICFKSTLSHLKNTIIKNTNDTDEKKLTETFLNSEKYIKTNKLYNHIKDNEDRQLKTLSTAIKILDKFDNYTDEYFNEYLLLDEKIDQINKYFLNKHLPGILKLNEDYSRKLKILLIKNKIDIATVMVDFGAVQKIIDQHYKDL